MSRALFVIGGFGLGNSTRCHALIEKLHSQGLSIDVATSSNGLWYFSDSVHIRELIPLAPLTYQRNNDRISFFRTLFDLPRLLTSLMSNAKKIIQLQRRNRYSFIATDSEYSPFLARPFLFTPLVSINNVFFTFSGALSGMPRSRGWQVWPALTVEYCDLLVQKYFSDFRIAPALEPAPKVLSGTLYCPPMIRSGFDKCSPARDLARALVVASGSGLGVSKKTVESLAKCESVREVFVVGLDGESEGKIKYFGRKKEISSFVTNSDFIVSNGGFSTISEALVSNRPILVIPIENHFEQIQNARFVESLGLGIMTSNERLETDLLKLTKKFHPLVEFNVNGAEIAAGALLSLGTQSELSFGHG